ARSARSHPATPAWADDLRGGTRRRRGTPAFLRAVARPRGRLGVLEAARRGAAPAEADGRRRGAAAQRRRQTASLARRRLGPELRLPPHGAQREAWRRGFLRGLRLPGGGRAVRGELAAACQNDQAPGLISLLGCGRQSGAFRTMLFQSQVFI